MNSATSATSSTTRVMSAPVQRSRLARHFKESGRITMTQARERLKIMHPAGRVRELRAEDMNILTIRLPPNGEALYVLASPTPPDPPPARKRSRKGGAS